MQDNYQIQAMQAKQYFLSYDQQGLSIKCSLPADDRYLYPSLFSTPYRIDRRTGDMEKFLDGAWQSADSHGEVMTLLDLLCDSDPHRHAGGHFLSMQAFGHGFHQSLGEHNPLASRFDQHPQAVAAVCEELYGIPFPAGDLAYVLPVFEDLRLVLQLWSGDEEFPPSLRFLWDENALQYLKYETMYYAVDVLTDRILSAF